MIQEDRAVVNAPWVASEGVCGTWEVGPAGKHFRAVAITREDAELIVESVNKRANEAWASCRVEQAAKAAKDQQQLSRQVDRIFQVLGIDAMPARTSEQQLSTGIAPDVQRGATDSLEPVCPACGKEPRRSHDNRDAGLAGEIYCTRCGLPEVDCIQVGCV